jgi:murein DD-endopeptidase MepM/ murein hydrolase activator NlpD
MKIFIILCLINNSFQNGDTILFPIYSSKIVVQKVDSFAHPNGILISPTTDFIVKSCSNGLVKSIIKLHDGKLVVIQSTNELFYSYALIDAIKVKKGQTILRGAIIGRVIRKNSNDSYIIFSVLKNNKYVNAKKYLIYLK